MQTIDMSLDYRMWDNTSAVNYEQGRRTSSIVDLPPLFDGMTGAPKSKPSAGRKHFVPAAKRRNLTSREMAASGGAYTADDLVWLLPDVLFPANLPSAPGDTIIELADDSPDAQPGTRWTVLEAGWGKNRQTRRLTCRDLVLSFQLRDLITIERPLLTQNASGAYLKQFPSDPGNPGGVNLYTRLPARVQLISKDMALERGTKGLEGKYEIIVGHELDVTAEDRIVWGSTYLDIVGYTHAQRIDELPRVIATRKV